MATAKGIAREEAKKSAKLVVVVECLKDEAVDKFVEGFSLALSQVQALHHGANILPCSPIRKVVDGRIVDLVLDD